MGRKKSFSNLNKDRVDKTQFKDVDPEIRKYFYNQGYSSGFSHAFEEFRKHLCTISLFILIFVVKSEKKYLLLRNLMIFTKQATSGERRETKKINCKSMPAIAPLEKVRKLAHTNPYNLEKGLPIYRNEDTDLWEVGNLEKNHYLYKGHVVPLLNTITRYLKWNRTDIPVDLIPGAEIPTVFALIWTDGARVNRPTLYGRARFIDKSCTIIAETATPMYYFYGLLGKDANLFQFSKIRNDEIDILEEKLFQHNGITFKVIFRYISGDNAYIWTDMAITGAFRCGYCVRSANSNWMVFNPLCTQRTVEFQTKNVESYGIKKITPWALQGPKKNHNQVICVVAVMHDLKHSLDHGIKLALHFTKEKGKAEILVTERLHKILKGTPMVWERHTREIVSNWDELFEGLLEHQPGKWGSAMCFLCNTKKVEKNEKAEELYYAQLQTYSFLYGVILSHFYQQSQVPKKIKKVEKCDSVYDHAIFNHLADQFWHERILPIYLSEDLGEAAIK